VVRPGDASGLLEANWRYDLDKKGTLSTMWGAVDVAQNPLTSAADYFPAKSAVSARRLERLGTERNARALIPTVP